jgi:hypothetical protein
LTKLKDAVFVIMSVRRAIQGEVHESVPVGWGFFVSAAGIALTAAHCVRTRTAADLEQAPQTVYGNPPRVRIALLSSLDTTFEMRVDQPTVDSLDITVLRAHSGIPPHCQHLPLPTRLFEESELLGHQVPMVHANIQFGSDVSEEPTLGIDLVNIRGVYPTRIRATLTPEAGHSGAALIVTNNVIVGLHSKGYSDAPNPATSAFVMRLDLPVITMAVTDAAGRQA